METRPELLKALSDLLDDLERRALCQYLHRPVVEAASEELGSVVVAVDCSGSIDDDDLARFAAEIEEIAAVVQCHVTVLYHDSKVLKVQEWEPTDGPLKLEPVGGGGTSHVPVFEWIARQPEPTCVVCLTDLHSRFPQRAPSYRVGPPKVTG